MPPKPAAAILQVFVFKNGEFAGTDLFTEREIVIGRDGSADLVLESDTVSRTHAVVSHDGTRIRVKDAGSTNGVFVNERKVEEGEVTRLDQVFVGEFALKLKLVARGGAPDLESTRETRVALDAEAPRATPARGSAPGGAPEPGAATAAAARGRPAEGGGGSAVGHRRPAPALAAAPGPAPASRDRAAEHREQQGDLDSLLRDRPGAREAGARDRGARPAERAPFALLAPAASPAAPGPDRRDADPHGGGRRERPPGVDPVLAPAGRVAERAASPAAHPTDDEEDDEAPYVPAFSMVRQALEASAAGDRATHVQVLVVRGQSLTAAATLAPGEAFYTPGAAGLFRRGPKRRRLVRHGRRGDCRVEFAPGAHGSVQRHGERLDLARDATVVRPGLMTAVLRPGESVELEDGPRRYHIRWVRPPALPADRRSWRQRLRPEREISRSAGISVAAHVLLAVLGILLPARSVPPPAEVESFAEVALDDKMHLEEPPPPPEPLKEAPAAPQPKPVPRNMQAAGNKRPRAGGTANAPPGVLGLLSKRGSSAAPGPAAALAAVSNLSAANAPAGSGGFRVSGLVSNLPTADILVGGGGGGLVTKGGAALLRGGGGGAGALAGKGDRKVGGLVQKLPQAMRAAGQGNLDRDAIQKVINQNVGQIQRCYERELLSTPGLSGKVEIEWTITTSGFVRGARQKFSSLDSVAAVNCILEKVKSWRFPQPKGGEVVVSYPFVFKSISF